MTQASLIDFCGSQARLVGDLIEPWKRQHDLSSLAQALETAIPSLIRGCELLEETFPIIRNSLVHGRLPSVLEAGTKYYENYTGWIEDIEVLKSEADEAIRDGFAISGFDRLEMAIDRYRRFLKEEVELLPRIDPEMLARSTAEYERGEFQSVREVIDELRNRSD